MVCCQAKSEDLLKVEMRTLYPIALAIQKHTGESEMKLAWKAAITRERKLCGPKACVHAGEIVCRNLAFTFSTSNVERLCLEPTDDGLKCIVVPSVFEKNTNPTIKTLKVFFNVTLAPMS